MPVTKSSAVDRMLGLLRCPDCRSFLASGAEESHLRCRGCGSTIPISGGVVRFVRDNDLGEGEVGRKTQASFGYEWTHFADWRPSGESNFADYFGTFDLGSLRGRCVLDAGCGMGRHTRQIAPFCGEVIAVDFSRAIDSAARNVADRQNVLCIQGDLTKLPVASDAFDFVYSIGVLHHIEDTAGALRGLVRAAKPGAQIRVYLYWKRQGLAGAALWLITLARKATTRLPFPVLRSLCWLLSVFLTITVVIPYRVFGYLRGEIQDTWPLSVYAKYPFTVLYNDQFDRFSAPIEKRYSRDEVKALLESVGLKDVQVHARFGWIADGIK
jgi:SAM-dependent methyltransferase/uncharacterized protein YbaR (Trm112 family)